MIQGSLNFITINNELDPIPWERDSPLGLRILRHAKTQEDISAIVRAPGKREHEAYCLMRVGECSPAPEIPCWFALPREMNFQVERLKSSL